MANIGRIKHWQTVGLRGQYKATSPLDTISINFKSDADRSQYQFAIYRLIINSSRQCALWPQIHYGTSQHIEMACFRVSATRTRGPQPSRSENMILAIRINRRRRALRMYSTFYRWRYIDVVCENMIIYWWFARTLAPPIVNSHTLTLQVCLSAYCTKCEFLFLRRFNHCAAAPNALNPQYFNFHFFPRIIDRAPFIVISYYTYYALFLSRSFTLSISFSFALFVSVVGPVFVWVGPA